MIASAINTLRVPYVMNPAVADRLSQVLKYNGVSLLTDADSLRRLLTGGGVSTPEVDALITLLQTGGVAFLQKWAQSPGGHSYEAVREHMVGKFVQAGALSDEAAGWALDAWARALNAKPVAVAPAAMALEPVVQPPPAEPNAVTAPMAAAPTPSMLNSAAPRSADRASMGANSATPVDEYDTVDSGPQFIVGGRRRSFGAGFAWIGHGWKIFAAQPLMWILAIIVYVVVSALIMLVPLVGQLASALFAPVLYAGLMLGAQAVDEGDELRLSHVFAGFRTRLDTLVLIGLLFTLGAAAIGVVLALLFGGALLAVMQDPAGAMQAIGSLTLPILLGALLFLLLLAAYGFAPLLGAIGERGVLASFKESFIGGFRNWLPGLAYLLAVVVLGFLASLPFGLGWIVLAPVLFTSVYAAYRDIYYED